MPVIIASSALPLHFAYRFSVYFTIVKLQRLLLYSAELVPLFVANVH